MTSNSPDPNPHWSRPIFNWDSYNSKQVRAEIIFEALFLLACALAALTWHQKILLIVVISCFKLAMPSWMTARIVFKMDPNRWHGLGLACLFTAWGFTRVALVGFGVLMSIVFTMMWLETRGVPINWAFFGLGICFTCVFASIFAVFPFCLAAFLIARYNQTPLYFAVGLTKLRRTKPQDRGKIKLDIVRSIKELGFASMASLAVWSVVLGIIAVSWLKLPDLAFAFAALFSITLMPIFWLFTFVNQVTPHASLIEDV